MPQLFLNNFQTQFIASVKAAPESASPALELDYGVLRVSDGAAGLLLNPGPGNGYVLTAFKRSGSAESDYELLHVTAVDNAVLGECRLTVLRGQEGTTPKSYVAGDIVELRLTAGGMGQYVQTTDARLSNSRAPTGAAGGVLSGAFPNPGFAQAMATAADLGGKVDKVAGKGLSANDYTNADMAKLAGVAEQATKNATDAALRDRASHTGAQAIGTVTGLQTALDGKAPSSHTHSAATNAAAGFMSAADKAKLDGVAASATANATDEALRARASHTGTQSIATIEGLQLALGDKVDVVAGKGLSSSDFTAAEKAKLGGIAASASANASDAELRARASHTGTQAISTVTGLQDALDGKQASLVSGNNIKTINGETILGNGDIVISAGAVKQIRREFAGTFVVPAGVSVVRFYLGGRGGQGGGISSTGCSAYGGGGGGFCFGDVAVVPGDVITKVLGGAGQATTLALNGVIFATANFGTNGAFATQGMVGVIGAGGTASITSVVVNGGAYKGGDGGSSSAGTPGSRFATGGGSCGSPLGPGVNGGAIVMGANSQTVASGGAGIGGTGAQAPTGGIAGGGGAGEDGAVAYGGGSIPGGLSRGITNSFTDPFLAMANGPRCPSGTFPMPGAGGANSDGGDFGGGAGSATPSSSEQGYSGGILAGGGGRASAAAVNGGNGGLGGGGGGRATSGGSVGAPGLSFCFFYY